MKANSRVVVAEIRDRRKFAPSISRSSNDSIRTFNTAASRSRNSKFTSNDSTLLRRSFEELLPIRGLSIGTTNSTSYVSKSFLLVEESQIRHNVTANICYPTSSSMPEESSPSEVHSFLLLHRDTPPRTSICRNKLDARASTTPSEIKSQSHHHSQRRAPTRCRRSYANRFPSPPGRHSNYVQHPL